jgi:hypothetical protein
MRPGALHRVRRRSSTHKPETRTRWCGGWSLARAAGTPRSWRLLGLMVSWLYGTTGLLVPGLEPAVHHVYILGFPEFTGRRYPQFQHTN